VIGIKRLRITSSKLRAVLIGSVQRTAGPMVLLATGAVRRCAYDVVAG
jgi:hypothetical protein